MGREALDLAVRKLMPTRNKGWDGREARGRGGVAHEHIGYKEGGGAVTGENDALVNVFDRGWFGLRVSFTKWPQTLQAVGLVFSKAKQGGLVLYYSNRRKAE
jgi:hypothetical protein